MEVNCEYRRLSHTKPKAQESVRQPSLERKDKAARERSSDWYCFGSDRQCFLQLFFFFCFLEIYMQQVVYVLRRTGSSKLPLDVIMSIEASHS